VNLPEPQARSEPPQARPVLKEQAQVTGVSQVLLAQSQPAPVPVLQPVKEAQSQEHSAALATRPEPQPP
jgi:hypothetical protein